MQEHGHSNWSRARRAREVGVRGGGGVGGRCGGGSKGGGRCGGGSKGGGAGVAVGGVGGRGGGRAHC